jgi:predicted small lipoprotein YifL
MPRLVLIACLALAACGADGPPEKPATTGVTLSGEAQVGVVVK